MTSAFSTAFSDGLISIYELMGEACVYRDKQGWNTNCSVMVERDLSQYGETANVQGVTAVLSVRRSEVADRPRRGDTFEMADGCTVFTVESVSISDDFEHQVFCS
jgi:hypothetical protein